MNQQRRSFFLAAGCLSAMAKATILRAAKAPASLSLATAISAALLFTSCASLTPERIDALANIAGLAAQIGAANWLQKHPENRPMFEAAIAAINALIRAGITNPDAYAEQLNKLPTDLLAGPEGDVMVSPVPRAGVLVWDVESKKAVVVKGKSVLPVAKSISRGLRNATSPAPPKLPTSRRHNLTVTDGDGWFEKPLSDAELDAQFESVKLTLKTNRVTDYVVERKVESNWTSVVLITNAPVGEWRVRRVK
jgi:hypothetical protein